MTKDARPWRNDGKRFVASLQDVKDFSCYKDFFESDTLVAAKEKADEAAEKHQRSVLVFDREQSEVTYKKVIDNQKKVEVKPEPPPRRGRKKAEPKKKQITKDDYFD